MGRTKEVKGMIEDKYRFYSRYLIRGIENFEFDTLLLPIVNDSIEEIYIYRKSQEVFVDLKIKKAVKKENWIEECNDIEKECKNLLDKLFYRLYVRNFYLSRIEYVHQKTSYLFAEGNVGLGDVTIYDKKDYYGKTKKLSVETLKDFEKVSINNPSYKYLSSILKIEEKAHRFVALYQYLIENKTIGDFVDWVKEESLTDEYGIKILDNPDENYRHKNPELDELSYLRTLIAHFNDQDAERYKKEYEEMIDRDMRIIIKIIKAYK